MNGYTLFENNQKFGLRRGSEEILPGVYDAIWEHSDSLFGFRDDEYYGFFSATLGKVILEPVLMSGFLLYKQHDGSSDKPRYRSEFGIHSKERVFIEWVYDMLKAEKVIPALDNKFDVVLVHEDGYLETLAFGDGYNFLMDKLCNLCFIEMANGEIIAYWDKDLPFFSDEDEQLYIESQPFEQARIQNQFSKYVEEVVREQRVELEAPDSSAVLPVYREFRYDSIPQPIVKACKNHLDKYYVVSECAEEYIESLIYLAWLFANNYVIEVEPGLHVPDDRYEFQDPDGEAGINLIYLRDLLELEQITPMLKVSEVTQDYLPALAFVN